MSAPTVTLVDPPTLIGAAWPAAARSGLWRSAVLVALGTALLAVSAKIQVPFWPVPMTMQTFVVLVLGMAYGMRLGLATMLAYIAEGFAGLPVFAGSAAGPAYLVGPTAGYLIGFVAAAGLVGWLAERGWSRSVVLTALAMVAGHVVIFAFGLAWLAHLVGAAKAVALGLQPFILATVLKTALAVAVFPVAWALVAKVK